MHVKGVGAVVDDEVGKARGRKVARQLYVCSSHVQSPFCGGPLMRVAAQSVDVVR